MQHRRALLLVKSGNEWVIFRHNRFIIPAVRGFPPEQATPARLYNDVMNEADLKFYAAWAELLEWLREYSAGSEMARFVKQADFTEYIYRMERPYQMPTTIMSASLSDSADHPVLLVSASPRHAVFKEVQLHPFDSHVYRHLHLAEDGTGLAEGKRAFTRAMLFSLADRLFRVPQAA